MTSTGLIQQQIWSGVAEGYLLEEVSKVCA